MDALGSLGLAAARPPEGVEKEVLGEAPGAAPERPRPGDVVTVELEVAEGVAAAARSWALGAGKPLVVSDLDIDRCVCTMRVGERAQFKPSDAKEATGTKLRLVGLERSEDLLGDGSLLRVRLFEGTEREEATPGADLRLRFSWRPAPPRGGPAEPGAEEDAGGAGVEEEEATTTVLLAGDPTLRAEAAVSREMGDLKRTLLRSRRGAVVVRGDEAPAAAPVVRVERAGEALLESAEGLDVPEARRRLEALLAPSVAQPAEGAFGEAREIVVSMEEGSCRCSNADWLRGYVGMRALRGLRAGQRCLLRAAPGQLPPGAGEQAGGREYDVEVLQVLPVEDISDYLCHGRPGAASKRTTRPGDSGPSPIEGCDAKVRLRVTAGADGPELLAERELSLQVASGAVCAAVDEVVPTMRQGEACEVRCSDRWLCTDKSLGLEFADDTEVTFHLELLSFERIDLQSLSVPEKMAYCTQRKEVGTRFFQEGLQHPQRQCSWFRALKRYRRAAAVLGGAFGWPEEERSSGLALRRLCRLNMAACWLKLEAWEQAERSCSLVLDEEPENPKALFRRGQALSELRDHAGAERCARALLLADPKNREAARLLAKARQSLRADAEQRRELFARMARGVGEAGEEQASSPREAAPAADGEGPGAERGAEELLPASRQAPLWPWALVILAGTSLSLLLAWGLQRHRQRAWRP